MIRPDGSPREVGNPVSADADLRACYRSLIAIRNRHPALRTGDFRTLVTDNARSFYAFSRTAVEDTVVIVINNRDQPQALLLRMPSPGLWIDARNNRAFAAEGGTLLVELPALDGLILARH